MIYEFSAGQSYLDAMWMEERKESMGRGRDQFLVGMRILAVDNDPVCFKVLETLLRPNVNYFFNYYHPTTSGMVPPSS